MAVVVVISPQGHLRVRRDRAEAGEEAFAERVMAAFEAGSGAGLLHLATRELETRLPMDLVFLRSFASLYLTEVCRRPAQNGEQTLPEIEPPAASELASLMLQAPPIVGLEYLRAEAMLGWWHDLDQHVRRP